VPDRIGAATNSGSEVELLFRSPHPDVQVPDLPLHEFVLGGVERHGDRPALIDGPSGRTLSYAQLAEDVERFAAGLTVSGFGKGDVLGIVLPNMPEYAVAVYGVSRAGGVSTTINPLYKPEEVRKQLQDSEARYLLTLPLLLPSCREAVEGTNVEQIFVLSEAEGATPVAALMGAGVPAPEVSIDPARDLVTLPYSSGTTGTAKGVMLTHRNVVANVAQMQSLERREPEDVLLGVVPFFHAAGLHVVLATSLHAGATVVTQPRFDLEAFLEAIQRYRVTWLAMVPPIVLALAKHPLVDRYDLSSVKLAGSGAAPLSAELEGAAARRLSCTFYQGWGMTEASAMLTMPSVREPERIRPGTSGQLVPNTEARVVDLGTGADLGLGQDGELWVRGPQVMAGYLKKPEESRLTLVEGGWLRTGDIGHVDEDGYVSVVDRAKELIKYKGFQVPPAEMEGLLLTHPAIADAAVIPVPDVEAGEIPKAYVVRKGEVTAEEIMDYVGARVAHYKRIRRVEFVESIPRSASGKVLRRELVMRERAAASASSASA
jgi:acyl-CoA synthetase (AMP-forming)/AMP-acid ligase II